MPKACVSQARRKSNDPISIQKRSSGKVCLERPVGVERLTAVKTRSDKTVNFLDEIWRPQGTRLYSGASWKLYREASEPPGGKGPGHLVRCASELPTAA